MEHRGSQSIVQDKSFRFAVKIVAYIRRQQKDHVNLVLTRQLIRSGTSIGANVEEALEGQSGKDFVAKLAIAAKEARKAGDGMDHYQILNEKCGMRNEDLGNANQF